MQVIPRETAKLLLSEMNNGTIYSVTFTKKDGTERLMNSIKGTRKGVTGEGLKYDADAKDLMPVYDLQLARQGEPENKCWRMVNLKSISKIVVDKTEFQVVD